MSVRNIGGDFGFGQCCLYSYDRPQNNSERYPSVVVPVDSKTASIRDADVFVDVDGSKYLVGKEAVESRPESRSTDTAFFFKPEYRILVMYGLRRMLGAKTGEVNLVTGLPIEHFRELRDKYKATVEGWNLGGIKIKNLIVIPQPAGVLSDPLMQDMNDNVKAAEKGKALVIDGGYGTMDIISFSDARPIPGGNYGMNYGARDIHEKIFEALKTVKIKNKTTGKTECPAFSKDFVVRSVDEVLRAKGFKLAGDWYELDERHYRPAFEEYLAKVREVISSRWGNLNGFDWVIFAGGVADMMGREFIAEHLVPPKILLMPKQSEMSVARGFADLATKKFRYANS